MEICHFQYYDFINSFFFAYFIALSSLVQPKYRISKRRFPQLLCCLQIISRDSIAIALTMRNKWIKIYEAALYTMRLIKYHHWRQACKKINIYIVHCIPLTSAFRPLIFNILIILIFYFHIYHWLFIETQIKKVGNNIKLVS